jgi:hypothetical protein
MIVGEELIRMKLTSYTDAFALQQVCERCCGKPPVPPEVFAAKICNISSSTAKNTGVAKLPAPQ